MAVEEHPWSLNSHLVDRFFVFAGYPARYDPVHVIPTEDPATADQRRHTTITSLLETSQQGPSQA
ncbi:hypothetical protein ACFV16_35310 [Streptomyces massasporeus]|uniref:hypothetical protein n=1 Tax=Streptomyces massasporeus TaxID=67324 RepID=UPI003683C32C